MPPLEQAAHLELVEFGLKVVEDMRVQRLRRGAHELGLGRAQHAYLHPRRRLHQEGRGSVPA